MLKYSITLIKIIAVTYCNLILLFGIKSEILTILNLNSNLTLLQIED